jgi:membrane-bound serine protease (ClpP class)
MNCLRHILTAAAALLLAAALPVTAEPAAADTPAMAPATPEGDTPAPAPAPAEIAADAPVPAAPVPAEKDGGDAAAPATKGVAPTTTDGKPTPAEKAADADRPAAAPTMVVAPLPRIPIDKEPIHKTVDGGEVTDKSVLVLLLHTAVNDPLLYYLRRGFEMAKQKKVQAVVIDMDTPGGSLMVTEEIINWVRALINADIPVYVYVRNDEKGMGAMSAGAIISLACTAVYMMPSATIGDAMPILSSGQEMGDRMQEKITSPTRALVRSLAEERGYRTDMAEAMVDPRLELKIGEAVICKEGQLLTLTAREAHRVYPPMTTPLLAKGIVGGVRDVVAAEGLQDAKLVQLETAGSEKIAFFINMLSPLLMTVIMIGAFMEMKTPGFGVPGIVALVALSILLFGQFAAGLAGYEEVALIGLGIVLLIVEVFVLPGFGVCGILGLFALGAGFFMAMIPVIPENVPELPGIDPITIEKFLPGVVFKLAISTVIGGVAIYFLSKYLPKTSMYRELVLEGSTSAEDGYVGTDVAKRKTYLGCDGMTETPLRPAGIATINGERVDVVSDGDFIDRGESVTVTAVQGARVVVSRATAQDSITGAPAMS